MMLTSMARKSWKDEFSILIKQGAYDTKQMALDDIEVAKNFGSTAWGWFENETEYNETIQMVNDHFK